MELKLVKKVKVVKPNHNKELQKEIVEVLKKHNVKNVRKHIAHMKAGGLFDSILKYGKKAVDLGKKAYNFYNNNKEAIHKGVDMAVKYAPQVVQTVKALKGGKLTGGKVSKKSGKLNPGMLKWRQKVEKYRKEHPELSFKEVLIACKESK